MEIVLSIASVLLFLGIAVWLIDLYMIYPGKKKGEMEKFTSVKFAHRGLHDEQRAENSLSAFAKAKELGFGIELDVRLSKDGELMVYHDDNLARSTGIDGKFIDFTCSELQNMKLHGTEDTIPTFREVLELIDGAVPLLIEIKMASGDSGVSEKLIEVIEGYKGDYIVESFNPFALRPIRNLRPDIMCGILSMEYMKNPKHKGKILYRLLQNLRLNFLVRPDFIAYEKNGYAVPALRRLRRKFKTPLITWTVQSREEEEFALSHGFDTVIFEGYIPER